MLFFFLFYTLDSVFKIENTLMRFSTRIFAILTIRVYYIGVSNTYVEFRKVTVSVDSFYVTSSGTIFVQFYP